MMPNYVSKWYDYHFIHVTSSYVWFNSILHITDSTNQANQKQKRLYTYVLRQMKVSSSEHLHNNSFMDFDLKPQI